MRHTFLRALVGLLALPLAFSVGCSNDVPIGTLCEGLTLQVDEEQKDREPVKLDFLWVIDNSSSMSQEQTALASSISEFTTTLSAFANVDIRTAVTTTYYLSDAHRGRFNTTPADQFLVSAWASKPFPVLHADSEGDLWCECAACQGFEQALAYQLCHDDADCESTPSMAPVYVECITSRGCPDGDDPCAQHWISYSVGTGADTYNLNGSLNVGCQLTCAGAAATEDDADAFCQNCLASEAMVCEDAASVSSLDRSGCVVPPNTLDCPGDIPAVLPAYDEDGTVKYSIEDYFRCIATVGSEQGQAAGMEQGLRQAWTSLSADGPHPAQICDPSDPVFDDPELSDLERRERCERVFLRDNAYLVIIFVSDEEDCSVRDGANINVNDAAICGLLGDADTPADFPGLVAIGILDPNDSTSTRPLATVSEYVNRLKSLKENPANVFVAAITGDVLNEDGEMSDAEVQAARDLYYASLTDKTNPNYRVNSTICSSDLGQAFYGSRYLKLAEMFGPHGFTANICSDEGIGPTLSEIATELISEVISICLPREVLPNADGDLLVTVKKTAEGETEPVILEQGVDFNVVDEPEEGACPGSGKAIRFEGHALPLPGDTIQILYRAQTRCLL